MTKRIAAWVGGLVLVALGSAAGLMARGDDPAHVKQLIETKQCQRCDFTDAKLKVVDVEKGNVVNSDFRGADLYKANFREADLTGAQFADANLWGADLTGAKGADLRAAKTNAYTTCPDGTAGPCNQ